MRPGLISSLILLLGIVSASTTARAEVRDYELVISESSVNFSGTPRSALTVNGVLPAPTLEFTEGDTARIRVVNKLKVESSIHWHGILLPNREDGVSYLTTPPILPGMTHTFNFPIIQNGTYWYHSHTMLQEQQGVYGAIVIHPKAVSKSAEREYAVVLSDWTDENPHEVLRTLKRGSHYYAQRKGALPSWLGALRHGGLGTMMKNEWERMAPMDISDVAYEAFLANGKKELQLDANPGERVRLRLINAGAATYFYVEAAGQALEIEAADGLTVTPVSVQRLLIAIAETYDVILKVPAEGSIEIRATAQDGSGKTSIILGRGSPLTAPDVPKPDLYSAHAHHGSAHQSTDHTQMSHQQMDHHDMSGHAGMDHSAMGHQVAQEERPDTPYEQLRSPAPTTLPAENKWREYRFELDGDMKRYLWTINGQTLAEADYIRIARGENVRFILVNKSMMHHPMHLHGHFFRVVNSQGEYSPLKHTVDVPPFATRVIEFEADKEKDWFFHCHVLYHMKSGMHQIVHYEGSTLDPDIAADRHMLYHDHWYPWIDVGVLSNQSFGKAQLANERNDLSLEWQVGYEDGDFELTPLYHRYINSFFSPFVGADLESGDSRGVLGFSYLLPLLLESRVWVDSNGDFRLSVDRHLQLTERLTLLGDVHYDTESMWEGEAGFEYTLGKRVSLSAKWHSDFGAGVGLMIYF